MWGICRLTVTGRGSLGTMPSLHHTLLAGPRAPSGRCILLLHGILGSGTNLRGAARALLAEDPAAVCVLADLRQHGRSQGLPPPHTVEACARDLLALARTLPSQPTEIVAHSFGGKVALAVLREQPSLTRVALLDSSPFPRTDAASTAPTLRVLDMLEQLPSSFASRSAFVDHVQAHGMSASLADWLAMNLRPGEVGLTFGLELPAIRALCDDYFARDLWPVVESSQARVDLVIGGRSWVWGAPELAHAEALRARDPARVRIHLLPDAGHWVHVDDPRGLVQALASP